jgi:hypothetical protein
VFGKLGNIFEARDFRVTALSKLRSRNVFWSRTSSTARAWKISSYVNDKCLNRFVKYLEKWRIAV